MTAPTDPLLEMADNDEATSTTCARRGADASADYWERRASILRAAHAVIVETQVQASLPPRNRRFRMILTTLRAYESATRRQEGE